MKFHKQGKKILAKHSGPRTKTKMELLEEELMKGKTTTSSEGY